MAKWIAAANVWARLRHEVICPNVTGRTEERIAQSNGACAGSLAIIVQPQMARTRNFRADVVLYFSGVKAAVNKVWIFI